MLDYRRVRQMAFRRCTLVAAMTLMMSLTALGAASPALATTHHPTGEFAPFADCPLSNAEVNGCVFAETNGGKFTVGKRTVPINKTIVLQGGFVVEETGLKFVGAEDGNTLSKVALAVPGGLLDILAPGYLNKKQKQEFEEAINKGPTGVTATTELAAPAGDIGLSTENLLARTGTALSLPVKIKLGNVFLGNNCYVGSNAAPIVINFTTGKTEPPKPNEPIEGAVGTFESNESLTRITLKGGKLVNNSFAAPGAEGCGAPFSSLIDEAVDAELGLPATAGHNTAILEGNLSTAAAEAVKASE
jgi:hypothetical protein